MAILIAYWECESSSSQAVDFNHRKNGPFGHLVLCYYWLTLTHPLLPLRALRKWLNTAKGSFCKKKPKKFLKQNNITIKIPVKKVVANRKTWTRRRMNDTLSINVENLPETTMFRCETLKHFIIAFREFSRNFQQRYANVKIALLEKVVTGWISFGFYCGLGLRIYREADSQT